MSQRPIRPPAPELPAEKRGSLLPIMLAVILAMAVTTALLFLTLGMFAYVIAAGLILFLVAGFHYLVWGRWLERVILAQVEEEERVEREQSARLAKPSPAAQAGTAAPSANRPEN
ncbi:MAG: hypothetical protein JNG90_10995 [Planctomycetaceae bacterium]|nr:hypothetical protein [Planctomycetaceae bacterium]